MKVDRATVLVCTYNRAPHLRQTLQAMLAMDEVPGCGVDIIVVDNNSTDNTPAVVAEAARDPRIQVTYLREPRQGKSFALNRGLADARSDIVALTDDDVLPSTDWLARIVADFRAHDVTFVFGKVLPRWGRVPPPELLTRRAQDVWGPLAIVDYGDDPVAYVEESTGQRLPVGANLAFARAALTKVGGWRTDLGKVNNTLISGEDHEIFMRLRRFGLYAGYYDPRVTVRHYVMLGDLYPTLDLAHVPTVAGVPRFLYRQAFQQLCKWLRQLGGNDALGSLIEELRMLQFAGLFVERWRGQARNAKVWNWLARRSNVRQARLAK
jgi:glycosyltransferase involved in cell wall biosynthesis